MTPGRTADLAALARHTVLDATFAFFAYVVIAGRYNFESLLQYIASGLLGRDTFAHHGATGWLIAALGFSLHFAISLTVAAVFFIALRPFTNTPTRTVALGLLYGAGVWMFMAGVVLPATDTRHEPFFGGWYIPFDRGRPIAYLSTDAGQPLTAVLERSTYVRALDRAAYNGGDDFLGSARERLFGFINDQTGANHRQAQGFHHLALDSHVSEDASADKTALINALRNGGDLLSVFGDVPTLTDPRHAQAYSPLWDAQLRLSTDNAIKQGLNIRQIDEVRLFNLAATGPDLLTGVDPATGQSAPYGAVGVDVNCAVLAWLGDKPPTANLATPAPGSQFPPR